ncbi:MAG: DUF551 domain-containing protein [Acholeplasmatales bacterium]|nr:DUF551 domain-containing protein [Acholeplasmatales bacterium]
MTKEEAKAFLNNISYDLGTVGIENLTVKDGEKMRDAIEILAQEPRWIFVSERLPEDHKDVLVYLSSDRISIGRYNSHKLPFCNDPIGWGYLYGLSFIDFEKEEVIAWMPLLDVTVTV